MISLSSLLLMLLALAPTVLANGHFSVRLILSALTQSPVHTTIRLYGVEKSLIVMGRAYVDIDYQLPKEHLIDDKSHMLSLTTVSGEDEHTEKMEIRRFSRSAHTIKGALRIIGEEAKCEKNFYGPFCWVECIVSPGDGMVCDSEGVARCKIPGGCKEPEPSEAPVTSSPTQQHCPCMNGGICLPQFSPSTPPVCQCPSSYEGANCELPKPTVLIVPSTDISVILILNVLVCLLILSAVLVLICIGWRFMKHAEQSRTAVPEPRNSKPQLGHVSISMPDCSSLSYSSSDDALFTAAVDHSKGKLSCQETVEEERRYTECPVQRAVISLPQKVIDKEEIYEVV